MFNLSYTSPHKGEVKTLKLKSDPFHTGLGQYEDEDGNLWEVSMVIGAKYSPNGKPYVTAQKVDFSRRYSTSDSVNLSSDNTIESGIESYKFLAYYVEVIKDGNTKV